MYHCHNMYLFSLFLLFGCVSYFKFCDGEGILGEMWSFRVCRNDLVIILCTIYHQGFYQSARRNSSLNFLHRRRSPTILGDAGPRWRMRLSLHLVLGLPCRIVHFRGVYSVTLILHIMLSLKRAVCPAHPCIPFLLTIVKSLCTLVDIHVVKTHAPVCPHLSTHETPLTLVSVLSYSHH